MEQNLKEEMDKIFNEMKLKSNNATHHNVVMSYIIVTQQKVNKLMGWE